MTRWQWGKKKISNIVFHPVDATRQTYVSELTQLLVKKTSMPKLYLSVALVTTEAILSSFGNDRYNLNVTDSACQKGKGEGGDRKTKTNLTQKYKNMPLDSYQQLRAVGALFTKTKGNIYQYLQQKKFLSHTGMRRQVAEGYSDDRVSLM